MLILLHDLNNVAVDPVLFAFSSHSVGMQSQPNGIACGKDGLVIVACLKDVSVRC